MKELLSDMKFFTSAPVWTSTPGSYVNTNNASNLNISGNNSIRSTLDLGGNTDSYFATGAGIDNNSTTDISSNFSSFLPMFIISEDSLLPDPLPKPIVIIFMILYVVIICVAVIGNGVVIIMIGLAKRIRSVTDIYILSLAVSDLMIATLNMPFQLYFIVANEWKAGEFLCKFTNYIQGVTVVASILTLLVIAFDRYWVICSTKLTQKLHSRKKAIISLAFVWVISLCVVCPHLIFQRLDLRIKLEFNGLPIVTDFGYVCAEFYPNPSDSKIYTLIVYVFLYLLPVVIMTYTYGRIAHRLWIHQPIGDILENPCHHQRNMTQRKRIIKMLIAVVLAFMLLWLPFFTFSLYREFTKVDSSFRIKMATLKLIGYSNCCVNPIIYTFLNRNFQIEFKRLFCRNRKVHVDSGLTMRKTRY
ncbi:hypothetical protein KUTeg_002954 [Tegillarca granosa]|uniref:G-protein coupled receptors family 1 profile domain-containing protein n=1 Tax=Tegillarca granosa TaxID=220873 RepID=A0ABQ9FQ73_TEGGR|nr:hypothetical protein KUTeg_002954 [Tegillarca granosa]